MFPDLSTLFSNPAGFVQNYIGWVVQLVTNILGAFGISLPG